MGIRQAVSVQLVFYLINERQYFTEFLSTGEHGNHHADRALAGSAQNGAELGAEQVRMFQAQSDSTQPQRWIG